mmetsp:Transcript_5474/g.10629  ORF Transcript_5474/g.10629 Transcript_5474/m.10629 type:complete len:89 (+) Transcript_5474:795-1061(+)
MGGQASRQSDIKERREEEGSRSAFLEKEVGPFAATCEVGRAPRLSLFVCIALTEFVESTCPYRGCATTFCMFLILPLTLLPAYYDDTL